MRVRPLANSLASSPGKSLARLLAKPLARLLAKSLALALLAALPGCALGHALWDPGALPREAEHLVAHTGDGWDISLIHYRAPSPAAGRRPVLVIHGVVTNERNLDYDERHSLARSLAAQGLDSFAMSLRGTGESSRASLFSGPRRFDWDFDTYCEEDLPAAIAEVQRRTGSEQVDVVGHSMGGMLLYCLLARGGPAARAVGAGVTLGSPVGFRFGPRFTRLASAAAEAGRRMPGFIALEGPSLLFLPLMTMYPEPAALVLYNPANMDPDVWSSFVSVGVEDESPLLAKQLAGWLSTDRFTSRDGTFDYETALREVRTPMLVVAGKLDQLGFPPLVRRGFDALGGEKRYWLVAEENGASADYGHMDLLLGERAREDVFAKVIEFLAARAAP